MKVSRRAFLFGLFPATLVLPPAFVSCSSGGAGVASPLPVSSREKSLSEEFFRALNSYRASQGKHALVRHGGLDALTARHADYLRKNRGTFGLYGPNVSHFGFESRALVARERYGMEPAAENVASGASGGVAMLMSSLKSSRDHNHAMLDSWHSVGCAVVEDTDGRLFGVQMFGTVPRQSALHFQERMRSF